MRTNRIFGCALLFVLASCAAQEDDKRVLVKEVVRTQLIADVQSAKPASWRGKTYRTCGYFAKYATDFEKAGKHKIKPVFEEEYARQVNYSVAFAMLITDPRCLRDTPEIVGMIDDLSVSRVLGEEAPPDVKLSDIALRYFRQGISRGATGEEMDPAIYDGRFEELATMVERLKPYALLYPDAPVWSYDDTNR